MHGRADTIWIGGLGIVFFTIAVLPIFGVVMDWVFALKASGHLLMTSASPYWYPFKMVEIIIYAGMTGHWLSY